MRTIELKDHPWYPNQLFWYVIENGKTISIWYFEQFADAIEQLVKPSRADEIFNSFFND